MNLLEKKLRRSTVSMYKSQFCRILMRGNSPFQPIISDNAVLGTCTYIPRLSRFDWIETATGEK